MSATPSAAVKMVWSSAQWHDPGSRYFLMATVASDEEHLVVGLLTYVELLKKDGM